MLLALLSLKVSGQASQTYGNPAVSEGGYSVTADNSGFMYTGGFTGTKGLIVKTDPLGNTVWSKELNLNLAANFYYVVTALDVEADTLFGCGFINDPSSPNPNGAITSGGFYFKMNKNTGVVYWIKHENVSDIYLSGMRYANGRYFLIGSRRTDNNVYDGNVLCVASNTGNYIWQSNTFGLVYSNYNNDYIDDFMGMSEVVNGQFYITGRSYINATPYNMRPILVGFDVNGNRILNKYLLVNQTASGNNRYYGMSIAFDGIDRLVITYFGDDNCTGSCNTYNLGIVKTDLSGNVIFSKNYDVIGSTTEYAKNINVTDDAYVISGSSNFSAANAKFIAMKVDKNGVFQKIVSVSKPGTTNQITMGGINLGGSSKFVNGVHYFGSAIHTGNVNLLDMFMVQLDEDLNSVNPCFDVALMNVNTINIPPFSSDLVVIQKTYALVPPLNGAANVNYVTAPPCDLSDISYNETTYGCDSIEIEIVSAASIPYVINWSSGASGFNSTFTTSDSAVIDFYNPVNCCLIVDTIDFQLGSSTLGLNMPNDTSICINAGGTFLIQPNIIDCNGCDILWSNNSTNTTLSVSNTGWYGIEVSNSCGTFLVDSIFVELNLNPTLMQISDTVVCAGDLPLTYNFSGNNVDSILWSNGSTSFSTDFLDSGSMNLIVYSQCGNITEKFLISIPENVVLDGLLNIDTCVASNAIINIPLTGQFYDSLFVNTVYIPNNSVTISSDTIINVVGSNGCSQDGFQFSVNFYPLPNSIFSSHIDTCLAVGSEIILNVDPGADTLIWWNGNTGLTESVFSGGVYYFTVSNNCGSIIDSIIVNYSSAPVFNVSDSISACLILGEELVVHASSSDEVVTWMPSGVRDSILISESGIYYYELTNACGVFYDSLIAIIDYYPEYTIEDTFFVCNTLFDFRSYGFQASNNYNVLDENGNILDFPITESGNYYFDMPSFCGSVYQMFNVQLNNEALLFAPNSFSPNGDEFNNVYEFKGDGYTIQSIRIYDRWGEIVFVELGKFSGWDGTYKGVLCQDGIYTVQVTYKACDEISRNIMLHVNLIK